MQTQSCSFIYKCTGNPMYTYLMEDSFHSKYWSSHTWSQLTKLTHLQRQVELITTCPGDRRRWTLKSFLSIIWLTSSTGFSTSIHDKCMWSRIRLKTQLRDIIMDTVLCLLKTVFKRNYSTQNEFEFPGAYSCRPYNRIPCGYQSNVSFVIIMMFSIVTLIELIHCRLSIYLSASANESNKPTTHLVPIQNLLTVLNTRIRPETP